MSRSALVFVLLALATAALFAADLAVGSVALSPGEVWGALTCSSVCADFNRLRRIDGNLSDKRIRLFYCYLELCFGFA